MLQDDLVAKISVEFLMREHYGIEDHQLRLDIYSLACGVCKGKEDGRNSPARDMEKGERRKLLINLLLN